MLSPGPAYMGPTMVGLAGMGIETVPIPAHAVQGRVIQNGGGLLGDDVLKKLQWRRGCGLPFADQGIPFQGVHDDRIHLPGPLYDSLLVYCPLYVAYRLPGPAVMLPR